MATYRIEEPASWLQFSNMGQIGTSIPYPNNLKWCGRSVFFALGTSPAGHTVWSYDGGENWSSVTFNGTASQQSLDIAGNGSVFCMVGNGDGAGYCQTANTPTNFDTGYTLSWTNRTLGSGYGSTAGDQLQQIIWTGTSFVAAGTNREIQTSPDGAAWTSKLHGAFPSGLTNLSGTITYRVLGSTLNGTEYIVLVIAGTTGTDRFQTWYTTNNGTSWIRITAPTISTGVLTLLDCRCGQLLTGQLGFVIAANHNDGVDNALMVGCSTATIASGFQTLSSQALASINIQNGIVGIWNTRLEVTSDLVTIYSSPLPPVISKTQTGCGYTLGIDSSNFLWRSIPTYGFNLSGSLADPHAVSHQDGGGDEINVTGLSGTLLDAQKIRVSVGSTSGFVEPHIKFLTPSGGGVTASIVDNAASNRVEVTLTSNGTFTGPSTSIPGHLIQFANDSGSAGSDSGISVNDLAVLTTTPPTPVQVQAAQAGISASASRSDHQHSVATGSPTSVIPGSTALEGSATTLSRSDHRHAVPAYGSTEGTITQGNDVRLSDDRVARGIRTASGIVSVNTSTAPVAGYSLIATSPTSAAWSPLGVNATTPGTNQFRLSPDLNNPVQYNNLPQCYNVYMVPYGGNTLALYNGTSWIGVSSNGLTYTISGKGHIAELPFDLFAYQSGSTIQLQAVNWSNRTTRAVQVQRLNGVWVSSSDFSRRLMGTITPRTDQYYSWIPTGYDEVPSDAYGVRLDLWNAGNRLGIPFKMLCTVNQDNPEIETWRSTAGTNWHQLQGKPIYSIDYTVGVQEDAMDAVCTLTATDVSNAEGAYTAFGLDSQIQPVGIWNGIYYGHAQTWYPLQCHYRDLQSPGFHRLYWLERAVAQAGEPTVYFLGRRDDASASGVSGIIGIWRC